ncbi:MAG: M3 family oligoendopeptidase, partial [Oscillospiraceae bacterium]
MKFCEYEYKRPNIDALCEKYTALCEKMAAANTLDEAVACVMEHERMTMEFVSDAELAEIRHTIDTRDKFYDEEKEYIAANTPRLTERMNAFLMMLLTSKLKPELEKRFPKVLFTNAEMSVKTVSPAVLGLLADEAKLEIDYQKLQASAQIEYDGKVLTLAQLGAYMENGDSAVRRSAFEATGNFYMDNADEFDRIFDELVKLRTEIAKKLGFETFTALGYLRRTRNCYDAAMVAKFREGVKKYIVPTVAEIKKRQAEHLGKEKIVYSDDAVLLPQGNPKPVGSFDETYRSGVALYRKMGSKTREFIDFMDESGLFDLEAKTGKAAGGYCTFIPNHHAPFVFSNFNGTAGDVEVFTHEGGHAFAAYVADKTCELLETGTPTYESAEVHSMSMEFLAWPWLDSFYGDKTETAKVAHLL